MLHSNRVSKLAALFLAAAVTGLAACSGGSPSASPSQPAGSSPAAPASASGASSSSGGGGIQVSAPGELPIVQEPVDLSVFIKQLSYKLTDVTTNTFTKELEDMTNVHLVMTVVPQDSYQEKLNLILASGDYPEVIMSGGFSNADLVKYGTQEQILIPLNDLIEQHGVNIKERWAEVPTYQDDMTTPDGNIYGIPSADSGAVGHGAVGYKLWLNTGWLDKLGLQKPAATEEFRNVLEAFKTQDPNGNGKADEIPMTGCIGTWAADIHLYLLNAFDYFNENLLKLKDGAFTGAADTDGFKEGLRYIAGLYQDGLIDPAALTQDDKQFSALGNNAGDVLVGAASCGHIGMFVSVNDQERASMYTCLEPLTGPNGYRGIPFTTALRLNGASYVITDKCKYPEVAIKLADTLCTMDMAVRGNVGIKGKQWDDADPDKFGMDGTTPATRKYLSYETSGEGATENDAWEWTCRLLEPNWKATFQVDGDIYDPSNYEARLLQETEKLRPYAADAEEIPPMFMDEQTSSRISQIKTPLQDYVKSSIVEFITGKKNVDADWDAYVQGLEKLNYKEYIQLNQQAYDAQSGE